MVDISQATIAEAARHFLETLSDKERIAKQAEVQRFIRWCGADRVFGHLHGQEVANYADTLMGGVTDATRRADDVRAFLVYAKKEGYTTTNLGTHLRLRKGSPRRKAATQAAPEEVPITVEEQAAREGELVSLKAQRPQILQDIKRAMEDKDFRENAPLDAARQQKAFIEGRIRELEATLEQAVIVAAKPVRTGDTIAVGSTVVLRNLGSNAQQTYTLAWPTDVDAAEGRISIESPVGKALLDHRAGDEIEVSAPSGKLRFRIEQIEL